jgi:hypothetical protein
MVRGISKLCALLVLVACDPVTSGGGADAGVVDAPTGADVLDPPGIDAGPDASTAACTPEPACGEAQVISSKAELVALVNACDTWSEAEIDRYRARTRTLRTGAELYLCPDDFALPAACETADPPCADRPFLVVDRRLNAESTVACNGVILDTGVSFRLRLHLGQPLFGFPNHSAQITFEPPCSATCADNERRCDANLACYPEDDVCFDCGLGDRAQCACRTPDLNTLPPCTDCQIFRGDFIEIGNCNGDRCVVSPDEDPQLCTQCPTIDQCVPS